MDELIKTLDSDYCLEKYRIKDNLIIFNIKSEKVSLKCPYCGAESTKVHSYYVREIQDLPIQNRKVILLVKTRKMFCLNKDCSKKTFSEKHSFVGTNGKKTYRLENNIILSSTHLSSVNASMILKANNIDICKSSICSLLKKNAKHCG